LAASHDSIVGDPALKAINPPSGDGLSHAEAELEATMLQLQAAGVLRPASTLDLNDLVDFPEERVKMSGASDQDVSLRSAVP
jgi:hypothetical protein